MYLDGTSVSSVSFFESGVKKWDIGNDHSDNSLSFAKSGNELYLDNNAGIGTDNPLSKLGVDGNIRLLSTSAPSCTAENAGTLYYSGGHLLGCTVNSGWVRLDNTYS
ncbi:hypothetical protein K9M79_02465 [Candidatus Woesearchaeota archaeon]|nr:hypothetical protein [Candidatus Woesearchaeota archaeon]